MPKILIIEDDQNVAQVLDTRLTSEGFEVVLVGDGLNAIKAAQDHRPDLIILDIMLPGGDGVSVLQRLRLSTFTNSIPVLVLTGVDSTSYKARVELEGVQGYLQKPYEPEILLKEVRRILGLCQVS